MLQLVNYIGIQIKEQKYNDYDGATMTLSTMLKLKKHNKIIIKES